MLQHVITAPNLKCYINGQLFGVVTEINWNVRAPRKGLRSIDTNVVQEFIPTTYSVGGRISVLRLHGDGGLEGSGIVGFGNTVILEKYVSIDLLDRVTNVTVFSCQTAVITGQDWRVGIKQCLEGGFTFEAIDYTNEAKS